MTKSTALIIERLKAEFGFRTDTQVASALGLTKANLSHYKRKGTIPYDALSIFADQNNLAFDWLLAGEGPKEKPVGISEEASLYSINGKSRTFLRKVIIAVENFMHSEKCELGPDKKADLIVILFEDLLKNKITERELSETIAKLTGLAR